MTPSPVLGVLLTFAAVALATLAGWLIAVICGWAIERSHGLRATTRAPLLAQARLAPLILMLLIVPAQLYRVRTLRSGRSGIGRPIVDRPGDAGRCVPRRWTHQRSAVVCGRRHSSSARGESRQLQSRCRRGPDARGRFAAVFRWSPSLVWYGHGLVAKQVTAECTPRELAAIAAHESAHVHAQDNLLRLLFRLTPGAGMAARLAHPIERAWIVAAEEAADERAQSRDGGVQLASALTKVARLAAESEPEALAVSTLIRGDNLSHRVRRLLESPAEAQWASNGVRSASVLPWP